jgi:ABC-type multidrug transport system fused ATPase/permease subunit
VLNCSTLPLLRITAPTLARHRFALALICVCIVVAGLFQFAPPLLMGKFLGVLIAASHDATGSAANQAARRELTLLFAAIATSVMVILGFQFAANRGGMWLSSQIGVGIRTQLHRAVLGLAFGEHAALDAGTLQTRILADSAAVEVLFSVALPTIAIQCIFVSGAVALILNRAPFLAPVVIVPLALLVAAAFALRRATLRLLAESAVIAASVAERIAELGNGARAIRLFGREEQQQQRFHRETGRAAGVARRLWTYSGGFQHALILNVSLCSYLMWYVGGMNALRAGSGLAINDLIAFVPIILLLFQPVYTLAATLDTIPKALAAAERITAVLDLRSETTEGIALVPTVGPLVFAAVRFAYIEGIDVLHDCSFSIAPGEFVALTGASGSGKSTLVNVMARLYEPAAGAIRWGPHDAREITPRAWRRAIGIVAQETFLFGESIRENIRCGRSWISDEAVEAAARTARADAFIAALPDGYETILGDGRRDVSGGQRQRLGIARALAGDPILLLLDEPTSALDAETEAAFLDGLELGRRGRTMLVVAHRPSTIERADRILQLSDGRISERSGRSTRVLQ